MPCEKCGYQEKKEVEKLGKKLCKVCVQFAPEDETSFTDYISEKVDWKVIDTYRKYNQSPGQKQKQGMDEKAKQGQLVTRAPFGYDVVDGKLVPNESASKVHSLFSVFLNKDYSLNSLAKNYSLSVNGVKKILTNRTYLGEIKFDSKLHKGTHDKIISDEIFYAVQRKLKEILKPRN